MAVAVHGVQHENMSRALGKPVDRLRQVPEVAAVAGREWRRRGVRDGLDAILLALRLPDPSQYRVDGDAVQPGREGALATELADLVPGLDESFLRTVFRLADISGHPQAKAVNLVDVEAVQGLKRLRV